MQDIPRHKKALIALRTKESPDLKAIQASMAALLKAFNTMITFSTEADQSRVIDEIESVLVFYLDCFKILNKTQNRLPWLTELDLHALSAFYKKLSDLSEIGCVQIYLGIISLFHEGMQSERKLRQKRGDSESVVRAYQLYQRALKIAPPCEPEQESELLAVPMVNTQPVLPTLVVIKPTKAVQTVKTYAHQFDMFAPSDKKREGIRQLMAAGRYVEALKAHAYVAVNHAADDYRCVVECHQKLGEMHFKKAEFQEAMRCYKEGLASLRYIHSDDLRDSDRDTTLALFNSLIHSLNEMTKNWSENFDNANHSMVYFLNYYLGHLTLYGLDSFMKDNLIAYLSDMESETQKEVTKVYLTIIAMFSQHSQLAEGGLTSMIEEIRFKQAESQNDGLLGDAFGLFQRAWDFVLQNQHSEVLNPEVKQVAESASKRAKKEVQSSSSSSLPGYLPPYGLSSSVTPVRTEHPASRSGFSRFSSK